MNMSKLGWSLGLITCVLALGGCAAPASGGLEVSAAWARTSPTLAMAGAVYLQITNSGTADDALTAVSVDATVAARAELHETVATGSNMGSSPMMEMRPVDRIVIPHGQTVMLQPGGYHVMLMDLAAPLEASSQIRVTLTFEHAGQIAVTADVRDTAP